MFKFGDYTLSELSELWDCSEDTLLRVQPSALPRRRRQYLFFGPILFNKQTADERALDVRTLMKQIGGTRAEVLAQKQRIRELQESNEQRRISIEETKQKSREQQEEFFRKMEEMAKQLQDIEKEQHDNER